ncbi:hypothetical protein [Haloferula rosea]|nr:hypothetical protein [Haloferula rosea]
MADRLVGFAKLAFNDTKGLKTTAEGDSCIGRRVFINRKLPFLHQGL